MRICIVYDCLFPHTVGGAERWYRELAQRLAAEGHEVAYLTLRQWDRGSDPSVPGVVVTAVGPRMALYSASGTRRILPPLVFGAGVLAHLLRHGRRYDVVHTASFPYFSLLAAALARRAGGYDVFVDWHEVWTRAYWREYLGTRTGEAGYLVQRLCVRVRQQAFCFSRLHGARLREGGLRGAVTVLTGEYAGPSTPQVNLEPEPIVLYAGRHTVEKRVPLIPPALALARRRDPSLRAEILGEGPQRAQVRALVEELGLTGVANVPGFVSSAAVVELMGRAACLIQPSQREGYGMVVIEAASHGTPSVVVAGPDNAATELIEDGENGVVAASASAEDLADAIGRVRAGGSELRARTGRWFAANATRLSLEHSLGVVRDAYERERTASS